MHDESGFANLAVFKVQPRFNVVLPAFPKSEPLPQNWSWP
jgi:hypothetical protein